MIKLIECPRDAMQGLEAFVPTESKVNYLNQLLRVGFDTLDMGSFVSAKAIPQMRDTAEVMERIDIGATKTNLLVIVANTRGAEQAVTYESIKYLGFPLSISETFQRRNTNKSINEALQSLDEIQNLCLKHNKQLVSYISMGFGNPYGDAYDTDLVSEYVDKLIKLGTSVISLADTVGVASPQSITDLFRSLSIQFPGTDIGVHLHSTKPTALEKISAAVQAGCSRIDGALLGYGGCPMANDDLVGNLPTEMIVSYLESQGIATGIDEKEFMVAMAMADQIFPKH